MGQRPNRNEIRAGRGHFLNILEGDSSGDFDERATFDARNGLVYLGRRHIIQQDHVRSTLNGFGDLLDGVYLHNYPETVRAPGFRQATSRRQSCSLRAKQGQVIILDQDSVPERVSVVMASA